MSPVPTSDPVEQREALPTAALEKDGGVEAVAEAVGGSGMDEGEEGEEGDEGDEQEGQRARGEAEPTAEEPAAHEPLLGATRDSDALEDVVGVEVCWGSTALPKPWPHNHPVGTQAVQLDMQAAEVLEPDDGGGVEIEMREQGSGSKPVQTPDSASGAAPPEEEEHPRREASQRWSLLQSEIPTILKHRAQLPAAVRFSSVEEDAGEVRCLCLTPLLAVRESLQLRC